MSAIFKKTVTIAAILSGVIFAAGCGTFTNQTFTGGTKGITQSVPDGRTVTCVVYGNQGISCDWDHAK